MNIDGVRSSGILMHITSLDSEFGIGDLGPAAYRFADKLKETGANLWQLLPLGPTGYGNSPYSARSTFAGNELLISPELLYEDGYLDEGDLIHPDFPSNKVNFNLVIAYKLPLLKKAELVNSSAVIPFCKVLINDGGKCIFPKVDNVVIILSIKSCSSFSDDENEGTRVYSHP